MIVSHEPLSWRAIIYLKHVSIMSRFIYSRSSSTIGKSLKMHEADSTCQYVIDYMGLVKKCALGNKRLKLTFYLYISLLSSCRVLTQDIV